MTNRAHPNRHHFGRNNRWAAPKAGDYTEGMIGLGFNFDYREIEKQLSDIEKKALPYAAAKVLNNAAFAVRNSLLRYTEKIFDRPNAYTRAAWLVDKANSKDGPAMSAAIKARPKQAAYLQFQIFGGVRGKGTSGSGPYDLFAYSAKLTKYGGVDRRYLKQISKQAKAEKERRRELASKRRAAAGDPNMTPARRRKLKWVVASKNKPGIFFGEIYGIKGYWKRSQRITPHDRKWMAKSSKIHGHVYGEMHEQTGKAPKGIWTKAGSHPELLFAVQSTIKNKPIFEYDKVVRKAFEEHASPENFRKALDQYL